MLLTAIVFIAILSLLVLVHELGHFLVAKKLKIKVEEFGFGLPPRALSFKKGETVYSINWLPIGGFVKLLGEDEAGGGRVEKGKKGKISKESLKRAFFVRPIWQRALVVTAGVIMNFLLAVVIISFLFSAVGVPEVGNEVIVSSVVNNSPAQKAGLEKGDIIQEINGKEIKNSAELISITKQNQGKEVALLVKSGDQQETIKITPREDYPEDQGPMGVAVTQNVEVKKYPWYLAPFVGTREALYTSWLIISGLGMILYQLIFFGTAPTGVAGPVGIAQLTGQFVEFGPYAILSFISLLSLNLAILNILPFPALDGGRLLFIVIEAVTGKKVNQKFESYAHAAGMAILLALIALVTFHDLIRLFTGQPILPEIR